MIRRLLKTVLPVILVFCLCLPAFALSGSWASSAGGSGMNSGPMPPNVSGMDEYHKQLSFAASYIEAGDYDAAKNILANAERLRQDDPRLYEMLGLTYDGDRQSGKAFEYFKKAGDMFIKKGNMDGAWRVLGWLRTFDREDAFVDNFEKEIRDRQEVINRRDRGLK